jgi:hypothetical protein
MPSHDYQSGDPCRLDAIWCNPGEEVLAADLYIALSAYGEFFFYPSWCHYPSECSSADHAAVQMLPGENRSNLIPEFEWPEITGSAEGLVFYGAMLNSESGAIIGSLSSWEFGYDE